MKIKPDSPEYKALKLRFEIVVKANGLPVCREWIEAFKLKRFLWDICHIVNDYGSGTILQPFYDQGLNDIHIEAALRAIWNDIQKALPATTKETE